MDTEEKKPTFKERLILSVADLKKQRDQALANLNFAIGALSNAEQTLNDFNEEDTKTEK